MQNQHLAGTGKLADVISVVTRPALTSKNTLHALLAAGELKLTF